MPLELLQEARQVRPRGVRVEAGVPEDVVQVDQALAEEQVEGVRLVLREALEVRADAVPPHAPVLELEEDRQQQQGEEIEQHESAQGVPEELPGMLVPR